MLDPLFTYALASSSHRSPDPLTHVHVLSQASKAFLLAIDGDDAGAGAWRGCITALGTLEMRSWSPDAGQHIFRAYRAFAGFSLAVSSNAIDVHVVPQEEVEAMGCSV